MAGSIKPLAPEQLYRRCDPKELPFATTADLPDLDEFLGQDRALEALAFGIAIRQPGYNLFALGLPGTGKHTLVGQYLEKLAAKAPVPPDLVYVNNFAAPQKPEALLLPPGQGAALQADMAGLIADLRAAIPALFESDDYRTRRQLVEEAHKRRQEEVFEKLQAEATPKHIALMRTPTGFAFAPMQEGAAMAPEAFHKLPEAQRQKIETDIRALQQSLEASLHRFPQWEREHREAVRDLHRQITGGAVASSLAGLKQRYAGLPDVMGYLGAVERDIVENVDAFLPTPDGPSLPAMLAGGQLQPGPTDRFRRYLVNLLVAHGNGDGAPVIFEDNPSMPALVGRIENLAEMGALVTDFGLIKAGALHRANGGYLLLEAHKLLSQPYGWEALKRALRARHIIVETPVQMLNMATTVSVEPEPVPLDLKVVLFGDRSLFYALSGADPDFGELFKVQVDFDDEMKRDGDSALAYARLVATVARGAELKPLTKDAVARVIEHAARLAGDQQRLTARIGLIVDLLREADHISGAAKRKTTDAADLQAAIDAQQRRADRVRERSLESIERDIMLIDTDGKKVGQINGLSVMTMGNFAFGKPTRITARVRIGRGEVVDIERQVDLGGPIHSKGVLILSAFLGARYAPDHPLSLSASIAFEQSYGGVDGDSASSAELYALLSELSGLPIDQSFAVTGAVNQHGEVQAIGGVNEKIEGFFDICRQRNLTGRQGVLIPRSNIDHLMLRQDIVEACAAAKFRIVAVDHIDRGIELLTGQPAGQRDTSGIFPAGSVNRLVEDRLIQLAQRRRAFGQGEGVGA